MLACVCPVVAQAKIPPEWTFAAAADLQGWQPNEQLTGSAVKDGALTTLTTGEDPFFVGPAIEAKAGEFPTVVVRLKMKHADGTPVSGQGEAQLFWTTSRVPDFSEEASVRIETTGDGQWHDYKFAVGENENWQGVITKLRFDPCEAAGVQISVASVRLQPQAANTATPAAPAAPKTRLATDTNALSVLPVPQKVVVGAGTFKLTPHTRICTDAASRTTGEYLAAQLRKSTGYKFVVSASPKLGEIRGVILLTTADAKAGLGAEGYELTVAPELVVIRAPEQAGLFYGVQTLLQLLPPKVFAPWNITDVNWTMPCVQIEDQPRFQWRGMMLDVSRQFFSKAEVKKVLDDLALHKLNTFHWHLTDDHGWRIAISKYPRLTEVGAWRKGIGFGMEPRSSTAYGPDGRYGGFYTQDDIREIVAYAAARHITIVPEIEMPAHSEAVLGAYPEFMCDRPTNSIPAVHLGAYCAGKDEVFEFLQNVLTEVIELFPGRYIHIGGDEVRKDNWKQCAKCQARIKAEGLKDEKELQSYFIRRVEKFINGQGRVLIGWSEILQGGLAQNATVMDWIGGAEEAASAGHDVVMSPTSACYFDYYQSANRSLEPKAQGGYLPLSRVYAFEPISAKLDPQFYSHILGAQGNLWTPYMASARMHEGLFTVWGVGG